MNENHEEMSIFRVFVKWPGQKKWSEIEDPGDYSLRIALRKCEIDAYRIEMRSMEEAKAYWEKLKARL